MLGEINYLNIGGKVTAEAVMCFIKVDAIALAKMVIITA